MAVNADEALLALLQALSTHLLLWLKLLNHPRQSCGGLGVRDPGLKEQLPEVIGHSKMNHSNTVHYDK